MTLELERDSVELPRHSDVETETDVSLADLQLRRGADSDFVRGAVEVQLETFRPNSRQGAFEGKLTLR